MIFEEYKNMLVVKENKIITETTVFEDNKHNIRLFCAPTQKKIFGKTAYFKLYDHKDIRKAKRVARICFYSPKYVIHDTDPNGCSPWWLGTKDIDILIEILNKKPTRKNAKYDTCWKELIYIFNHYVQSEHPEDIIPESMFYKMPDYTKLKYREVIK